MHARNESCESLHFGRMCARRRAGVAWRAATGRAGMPGMLSCWKSFGRACMSCQRAGRSKPVGPPRHMDLSVMLLEDMEVRNPDESISQPQPRACRHVPPAELKHPQPGSWRACVACVACRRVGVPSVPAGCASVLVSACRTCRACRGLAAPGVVWHDQNTRRHVRHAILLPP